MRVVVPDTWLSPFTTLPSLPGLRGQNGVEEPGKSKLMSQNGSIVVETPLWKRKEFNTYLKEIKWRGSLTWECTPSRYLLLRTMGSTSPLEGTQRWQKHIYIYTHIYSCSRVFSHNSLLFCVLGNVFQCKICLFVIQLGYLDKDALFILPANTSSTSYTQLYWFTRLVLCSRHGRWCWKALKKRAKYFCHTVLHWIKLCSFKWQSLVEFGIWEATE